MTELETHLFALAQHMLTLVPGQVVQFPGFDGRQYMVIARDDLNAMLERYNLAICPAEDVAPMVAMELERIREASKKP